MTGTLRDALRRATTLDERLRSPAVAAVHSPAARERFEKWARYAAGGDEAFLLRRLSWDGFDRETALSALEDPPEGSPFGDALDEAMASLPAGAAASGERLAVLRALSDEPLPPFAVFATALLQPAARRSAAGLAASGFSPRASAQLERAAVRAVASLLQFALYDEYRRFPAGAQHYERFSAWLLDRANADSFFAVYPVAARGIDLLLRQYEQNAIELAGRLESDRPALEALFPRDAREVSSIRPAMSDRHDGGRQVAILEFASGLRLVYKPRAVTLFEGFQQLIAWFRTEGFETAPPRLLTLAREGYGWIEAAEPGEPDSAGEYFERAGALLFLTWLVSARDLHMENVIATADGPVAVDLDALFAPEEPAGLAGTFREAQSRIGRSALATGLLTFSQADAEGRVYEAGGLCGTGGHLAATDLPVWREDGTDGLHLSRERRRAPRGTNVVTIGGVPQRAEDHAEAIVNGFRRAYDFARDRQERLLRDDGPLACFRRGFTRVIFRPSETYAAIQARMLGPACLRDGLEASLLVETLNRTFVNDTARPRVWPLAREEREDLLRWDVPMFHAAAGSVDLVSRSGETVRGWFARSGAAVVTARVQNLSPDDRDLQCELISAALASPALQPAGDRPLEGAGPLGPDEALATAIEIAGLLWSRAVKGEDGGVAWIGSRQLRMDERTDRGVSYYLYDGSPGVALLFAALYAITGDETHRRRAASCMRSVESAIRSPHAEAILRNEGIGAANGLGSIVIALARAYGLTGDRSHLELAGDAARFITAERIARDTRLDVEGGAAGALSALHLLFGITRDPDLLDRAGVAARFLADRAVPAGEGIAWPSEGGIPLAGYAHGASGIAAALARHAADSGNAGSASLAHGALRFERGVFDHVQRNWPVLAPAGVEPLFMNAWCHGAAGGVLARLSMRDVVGDADLDAEIAAAAECVLAAGAATVDHLCCGTMGRVDSLLSAGEALSRDDLRDAALRLASAVVREARRSGGFALFPPPHHRVFEAGLFRGLSGIGYELLRVTHPARLPSLLSFAAPATGVARSR